MSRDTHLLIAESDTPRCQVILHREDEDEWNLSHGYYTRSHGIGERVRLVEQSILERGLVKQQDEDLGDGYAGGDASREEVEKREGGK